MHHNYPEAQLGQRRIGNMVSLSSLSQAGTFSRKLAGAERTTGLTDPS
jgi:hypothetical protein